MGKTGYDFDRPLVLQMQEVGTKNEAEFLSNKKRLDACDLLCFVYDTSDVSSFEYVAALRVSWYILDVR